MIPQENQIVDIPRNREKFFGGPGKMLLPSPAEVESVLIEIPLHRLLTTGNLRQELTRKFRVQGTCPVTIQKALVMLAHDPEKQVPYWRVINQNGGLISRFPGGVQGHAARLQSEGFKIEIVGNTQRVKNFKAYILPRD
jgi:alkylated DNA nucleotide flippase Atl1